MNKIEFQQAVFAAGHEAGFDAMEIYAAAERSFSVRVFQKDIDNYSLAQLQGVGFRGRYNGKMGYAYTEILDSESVRLLVDQAKANAVLVDADDEVDIFAGSAEYPEVDAFNAGLAKVSVEAKIAFARELEEHAFAADSRVVSVNYALFGDGEDDISLANSKGLSCSFRRNTGFCYVMVVVKEGNNVKTGSRFTISNNWDDFSAADMAAGAVKEAVSMLAADSVNSGSYSIVLRNDTAADLLRTFSGVFSAENVQKGLSRLEGRLNDEIAAAAITLRDDPLLADGAASAPFDSEGVACYTKNVIEKGVLQTFLHNLKTAAKDKTASTGNGNKASFKSPVGIAPSNFFIQPGSESLEALQQAMGDGLLITDLQGLHSGANPVSGDFSLAAAGYRIENGQATGAVDQITIAGNFFDLLQNVRQVGSDLKFGMGGSGGNVGSPSLWIDSLAIAGK